MFHTSLSALTSWCLLGVQWEVGYLMFGLLVAYNLSVMRNATTLLQIVILVDSVPVR
jgi:hypothetical protein